LSEERAHELVDDVGLHYFRHYFISQCVMAGMDFRVIAEMVSHRDGGLLIGKKYSHLAPGHLQEQAAKLNARSF
jgi:site-specific recombinase XerD